MAGAGGCGGGWHSQGTALIPLPAGSKEWVKYQEAEYKFFEHHSTWVQAERICSWYQAKLASVHDEAELRFLGQNLKKVPEGSRTFPGTDSSAVSPGCSLPSFFHSLLEGHYLGTAGLCRGHGGSRCWCLGAGLGLSSAFCCSASCRGAASPHAWGGHGCP